MTTHDWYVLWFVLTIIAAISLWSMAVIIFRKSRGSPPNQMLALAFLFGGLWVLCGFVDKIFSPPNNGVTLWSFRLAYLFGDITMLLTFLFVLVLNTEKRPRTSILISCAILGAIISFIALTPLGFRSASYTAAGEVSMDTGLLYSMLSIFFVTFTLISIFLIAKKRQASSGIDKARANIIFSSMVIIFPTTIFCTYILPAATGNSAYTDYTFLIGAFVAPVFYFYAIVRYRLLEVRFIIRKSGLILIGIIFFSIPLLALYAIYVFEPLNSAVKGAISIAVLLPLFILSPQIWRYLQRASARVFFSGLYDSNQLEIVVSNKLAETDDQIDGIFSALKEVTTALGLLKLELVTLPQVLKGESLSIGYYRGEKDSLTKRLYRKYAFPDWLDQVNNDSLVTEELCRWPKTEPEKRLGETLDRLQFAACVPCRTATKSIGYLMVGGKVSETALSSTDITFLERIGLRLGLYFDNYALSADLRLKVDELEMANQFKMEIIALMAHEFRTPITVASGMAQLLSSHWEAIEAGQRNACLKDMDGALHRLTEMVEQAFQISSHQKGLLVPSLAAVDLSVLLDRTCASYPDELRQRLVFDVPETKCVISTDLEYLFVIFKNVVDNALRFSPKDQPVCIRATQEDTSLLIEIQDFGRGMSDQEVENIFDPFTRVESLEHHGKGAGLGLYIVKLLTDQLEIPISIDSVLGKGTTVSLQLVLQ
jgi:signal transduction histidine kinase